MGYTIQDCKYALPKEFLVYNNEVKGVRFKARQGYFDFSLDVAKQVEPDILKRTKLKRTELKLVNDEFITSEELESGERIPDCSDNKELVARITKYMKDYHEMCRNIDKFLQSFCSYNDLRSHPKSYNFSVTDKEVNFRSELYVPNKFKVFNWNDDNLYCEYHYDAWGVIDNCPRFDAWEDYGKKLLQNLSDRIVSSELELRGVKHEISLSFEFEYK